MMDCRAARERLVGFVAGRLAPDERAEVSRHLEECAECRRAADAEAQLSAALDRLPRHAAPRALKRRLEELVAAAPGEPAAQVPHVTASASTAPGPVPSDGGASSFSSLPSPLPSSLPSFLPSSARRSA